MTADPSFQVVLVDVTTAAALAQIMPVLLLTLTVELRRTKLHRAVPRRRLATMFLLFAVVETLLVLSIDGALYPFQWFDLASALFIFSLLAVIFYLSLVEAPPKRDKPSDGDGDESGD